MEQNFEQRAAIKFCCKAGFIAAKMREIFVKAFGDSFVSHATVFRWHSQFTAGEELIVDAEQKAGNNENKQKHLSGGSCFEGRPQCIDKIVRITTIQ